MAAVAHPPGIQANGFQVGYCLQELPHSAATPLNELLLLFLPHEAHYKAPSSIQTVHVHLVYLEYRAASKFLP